MTAPLRRVHLFIWLSLTPLLIVGLILAILLRKERPIQKPIDVPKPISSSTLNPHTSTHAQSVAASFHLSPVRVPELGDVA